MKQNVTLEQVGKLSVNQLNKLVPQLDIKHYYILAKNHTLIYEENVLVEIANALTIGKMIEVLRNHYYLGEFMIYNDSVTLIGAGGGSCPICWNEGCKCKHDELCDALWDAVVEMIKNSL
jgi:hypothetical protein